MKTNSKLCFVLGTRPEVIKLSPIIKECVRLGVPFIVIHTGQHYSENMDQVFFRNLDLPTPDYNLGVGSASHGAQTAAMLIGIEEILIKEKPNMVIVQGDTNSVLAGALAAVKLNIRVAHVEAGLRSRDWSMPEELNRILAGSVASLHFTPTKEAAQNLVGEGVPDAKIFTVGNTVVDAVLQNAEIAHKNSAVLAAHQLQSEHFALVTIHRPENTDFEEKMHALIDALELVIERQGLHLVWPIHPRTHKQLIIFGLEERVKQNKNITLIEPVDFLDMLELQQQSKIILTDSGGIQEESCILKVPCVTIRNNTERQESVAVGANMLAGCCAETVATAVEKMLESKRDWINPFGDGTAGKSIVATILKDLEGTYVVEKEQEGVEKANSAV